MSPRAALCLALLAIGGAGIDPALASDPLVGKTLSGSVRVCRPQTGQCATGKVQAYISSAGRIFDYTGSETGTVAPVGRWVTEGEKRTRYNLRNNVLSIEQTDAQFVLRASVRAFGQTCQAVYDARIAGTNEQLTVEVLSCLVRQGNHPF